MKVPSASRKTPSSPGSDRGSDKDKSEKKFLGRRSTNKSPVGTMNHCQENEAVANEPEDMDTQEGKILLLKVSLSIETMLFAIRHQFNTWNRYTQ